jgi:hypothetical protein
MMDYTEYICPKCQGKLVVDEKKLTWGCTNPKCKPIVLSFLGKPKLGEFDKSYYSDDQDVPYIYIGDLPVAIGTGTEDYGQIDEEHLRWKLDFDTEYQITILPIRKEKSRLKSNFLEKIEEYCKQILLDTIETKDWNAIKEKYGEISLEDLQEICAFFTLGFTKSSVFPAIQTYFTKQDVKKESIRESYPFSIGIASPTLIKYCPICRDKLTTYTPTGYQWCKSCGGITLVPRYNLEKEV